MISLAGGTHACVDPTVCISPAETSGLQPRGDCRQKQGWGAATSEQLQKPFTFCFYYGFSLHRPSTAFYVELGPLTNNYACLRDFPWPCCPPA